MYKKESSTNNQNQAELINDCPLLLALSLIGNRWKPYILWKLNGKVLRYGEIKREIPQITERMLILSLKELENNNLITRKDYKTTPPKVEYALTDTGNRLQSALNELYTWGISIVPNPAETSL